MKRVCISGYFDPIHVGHLEYIKQAKALGDHLTVIVNSDHQAELKKGCSFMPEAERVELLRAIRWVDNVVLSVDRDRTVCKTLATLDPTPDYFCNGGDQNNNSIPEAAICEELGIELVDGLGNKIQSSSWLIAKSKSKSKSKSK